MNKIIYQAHYNADKGDVIGYYRKDVQEAPNPFIEITEQQYKDNAFRNMCIINGEYKEKPIQLSDVLVRLREVKLYEIKRKKDELQYANIKYNGIEFFATTNARKNLEKAESYARRGDSDSMYILNNWLDVNNDTVSLTDDDAFNIIKIYSIRDNSLYRREAELTIMISVNIYVIDKKGKPTGEIDYQATIDMINNIEISF